MTTVSSDLKPQFFDLRARAIKGTRGDIPIYTTDLMWTHVKIYTVGGENDLHMHPTEEHSFIVLEGEATFYDKDGTAKVVKQYEGVLLPRGTYYRFASSGPTNLVMLRSGAGVNSRLPGMQIDRRGASGEHMASNPAQAGKQRVDVPGEFLKGS